MGHITMSVSGMSLAERPSDIITCQFYSRNGFQFSINKIFRYVAEIFNPVPRTVDCMSLCLLGILHPIINVTVTQLDVNEGPQKLRCVNGVWTHH